MARTEGNTHSPWKKLELRRFSENFHHWYYCMIIMLCFSFQLGNLERKWQHHEQNNFVMKECILYILRLIVNHHAWILKTVLKTNQYSDVPAHVLVGSNYEQNASYCTLAPVDHLIYHRSLYLKKLSINSFCFTCEIFIDRYIGAIHWLASNRTFLTVHKCWTLHYL